MTEEVPQGETILDLFSPTAQSLIKKAAGIGVTVYLGHALYTSPEFQDVLVFVRNWGAERNLTQYCKWFTAVDPDHSPLFEMPTAYRHKIWEFVPPQDLKTLRLVCKQFQWDVDYGIGVHAMVDARDVENYLWVKNVVLQGCSIISMENPRNWDFIENPDCLKVLKMTHDCIITPSEFGGIFSTFPNLESISVYVLDDCFATIGRNQEIFSYLWNKEQELVYLRVQYMPDTKVCKWEMKFCKFSQVTTVQACNNNDIDYLPTQVRCIVLNFQHFEGISSVNFARTRIFWKQFLELQRYLRELCCNYGPVCWDVFAQVIESNVNSIKKIELHNVNNWDFWSAAEHGEVCFDWNFFQTTKKLDRLVLITEPGPRPGPLLYLPLEPCEMHLNVIFFNLGECFWKTYESVVWSNTKTLKQATLLRVSSFDPRTGDIAPFDWSLFKECKSLTRVIIGGQFEKHLNHVNLELLPKEELQDFKMCWAQFTRDDLVLIGTNMLNMNAGFDFLDNCTFVKLAEGETAVELVQACRYQVIMENETMMVNMENLAEMMNEYSIYILGIIGTVWLLLH